MQNMKTSNVQCYMIKNLQMQDVSNFRTAWLKEV